MKHQDSKKDSANKDPPLESCGSAASQVSSMSDLSTCDVTPDSNRIERRETDAAAKQVEVMTMKRRKQKMTTWTVFPFVILFVFLAVLFGIRASDYVKTTVVHNTIVFNVELADTISELQKERDLGAFFINSPTDDNEAELTKQYKLTDKAIKKLSKSRKWEMTTAPQRYLQRADLLLRYINMHRYEANNEESTQKRELTFYSELIEKIIDWSINAVSEESTGSVWKLIVSMNEVVMCKEMLGVERGYGSLYFVNGRFHAVADYISFAGAQDVANNTMFVNIDYRELAQAASADVVRNFARTLDAMRHEIRLDPFGKKHSNEKLYDRSRWWHGNMTTYMTQLLVKQKSITIEVLKALNENAYYDRMFLVILGLVMAVVMVIFPFAIKAIRSMMNDIAETCDTLSGQTIDLTVEKRRTNKLLHAMLPKEISIKVKLNQKVDLELFQEATVFFSEVTDFANISSRVSPDNLVDLLKKMYSCVDDAIKKHDVYNVDIIGDAYMVVSGLPHRNERRHAGEIASMALYIKYMLTKITSRHYKLGLKMGVHSGKVVAGVVGKTMPRYCLFGHMIKVARSVGGGILISEATKEILDVTGNFATEKAEDGKLEMNSYWLNREVGEEEELQNESANSEDSDTSTNE